MKCVVLPSKSILSSNHRTSFKKFHKKSEIWLIFVLSSLHKISFPGCFLPCTTPTCSYPSLFIIIKCWCSTWSFEVSFGCKYVPNQKFWFSPIFLTNRVWINLRKKVENCSCSRLSCVNLHDFKCFCNTYIIWLQKNI